MNEGECIHVVSEAFGDGSSGCCSWVVYYVPAIQTKFQLLVKTVLPFQLLIITVPVAIDFPSCLFPGIIDVHHPRNDSSLQRLFL